MEVASSDQTLSVVRNKIRKNLSEPYTITAKKKLLAAFLAVAFLNTPVRAEAFHSVGNSGTENVCETLYRRSPTTGTLCYAGWGAFLVIDEVAKMLGYHDLISELDALRKQLSVGEKF